ncbi:YfcC family protein [Paenibacillus puldeungensis]|uniref:YfcC family protein n=1 Tax=Paenibacillus puldeungensis TaxID=696536 RepID=A0ABW3RSF9_9BACL
MFGRKKETNILQERQFKSPNAYVIIFFILVLVAVLTWIVPGGQYQLDKAGRAIAGTYSGSAAKPQGLWDILMAPIIGMIGNESVSGAIAISLNIMLFGSFLEMMDQSGAIKLFLKRIAIKNQKNFHALIVILVTVMGIFGTVQGSYEEGFVYLMMFLPIVLALGLDTMVAVMIVVFGTQGGCLASIVNPFATGIASSIAGISPGNGMIMRVIIFVVFMAIISYYICRYADKVKKNPQSSPQFFRRAEDLNEFPTADNEDASMTKEQKIVLGIFCATFAIMIVSLIPWSSLNSNWTFFEDLAKWIADTPVLGTVLGKDMVPLGQWFFNEINAMLIVSTIISGYVLHYKIDKTLNILIKGAAGLVSTAFIVPLARGIQVIMNGGAITPTILHFGENTLSSLPSIAFVVVCLVFYLIMASFIPSSTGLAAATMSIMAPLAVFAGVKEEIMVDIYLMALGMAKMIMPTSIIVMTCTQAAHIGYGQWVKSNWKFMIVLFSVSAAFLIAGVLI